MHLNKQEMDGSLDRFTKKESLILKKRKIKVIYNSKLFLFNFHIIQIYKLIFYIFFKR